MIVDLLVILTVNLIIMEFGGYVLLDTIIFHLGYVWNHFEFDQIRVEM